MDTAMAEKISEKYDQPLPHYFSYSSAPLFPVDILADVLKSRLESDPATGGLNNEKVHQVTSMGRLLFRNIAIIFDRYQSAVLADCT